MQLIESVVILYYEAEIDNDERTRQIKSLITEKIPIARMR